MTKENKLFPEDQAKVDTFLVSGVNSTDRKPFRPVRLLLILIVIVNGLGYASIKLAELVVH
jgi:hypothetical protein